MATWVAIAGVVLLQPSHPPSNLHIMCILNLITSHHYPLPVSHPLLSAGLSHVDSYGNWASASD